MNYYLKKTKHKDKAFTLLECLLALLILTSIYFLIIPVIKASGRLEERIRSREQLEWHVFLIQLSKEIEETHLLKLEKNKLLLFKEKNDGLIIIEQYKSIIRKRVNNGHQPLLTEVGQVTFTKNGSLIRIEVIFLGEKLSKNYVAFYSLKPLDKGEK